MQVTSWSRWRTPLLEAQNRKNRGGFATAAANTPNNKGTSFKTMIILAEISGSVQNLVLKARRIAYDS